MQINVSVTDANNIVCEVVPPQQQIIVIDRGVEGNGIVSIVPVTISTFQYLRITYTNGTVQDVGPLTSTAYTATSPITIVGNTISLATVPIASGGTDATTAAGAIQNLLPSYTGNANKRLGLNSGGTALEWVADGGGTVTSINASGGTTGLSFTGGPITSSGTLTLSGTLAIANGGTGQITANAAFNALVPSQTGNAGKYLTTDGTDTSWATNPLGTVTSVAATVPSFLSVSGSPITTSGTLAITYSGTALPIANGGTGQTTANAALNALLPTQTGNTSKYLQTDGTNATWDAISLSTADITGILPTANGGTGLSSFTANGVVYASSTSALATGSALTFDGSDLAVGNAGGLALFKRASDGLSVGRVGSRSSTDISVYNAGGVTAEFVAGANELRFNVSAAEQMRLTTTGLGIGTSSPTDKLTLNSSGSGTGFKITGYQPENFINLNNTLSTGNRTFRLLSGITSVGYDGFSIFDTVANATRLVINNSGNLGIATTSPSYKLDVNGDARINNLLWFTPSSGGMALGANGTNFEIYNGAGTETRLTLNNSGNLGIGTSSPTAKLDVIGAVRVGGMSGATGNKLYFDTTSGAGANTIGTVNDYNLRIECGRGATSAFTAATNSLEFEIGASEVGRFTSTGLGIGTSSPAYKLDVQGATGTTTSGVYETSASGSSIAISRLRTTGTGRGYWDIRTGNTASGLTGALDFFDNIAGAARVTFDNAGNVGIGTSSPTQKLHVENGNILARNSSLATSITAQSNQNTAYTAALTCNWDENILLLSAAGRKVLEVGGYTAANSLRLFTDNSERARIDSSGNFLLGTTSALGKFTIGSAYDDAIVLQDGRTSSSGVFRQSIAFSNYYGIAGRINWYHNDYFGASVRALAFELDGSEKMRITNSGNVGIGTSTVGAKLEVYDAGTFNARTSGINVHRPGSYGQYGSFAYDSNAVFFSSTYSGAGAGSYGQFIFQAYDSSSTAAERARIDVSGNFLVGTSVVTGAGASVGQIVTNFNGAVQNGMYVSDTRTSAGTDNAINFGRGSTLVGRLDTTLTSLTLTNLSDQRVKTNVQDSASALVLVDSVKVRQFDWTIDNSHEDFGFVAQELNEVLPQAVSIGKTEEEMWGVNFIKLVPILTKAIQEQQAIIESLKARLDAANL